MIETVTTAVTDLSNAEQSSQERANQTIETQKRRA